MTPHVQQLVISHDAWARDLFLGCVLGVVWFVANAGHGVAQEKSAATHDMLLLLPEGPIHLRIDVTEMKENLRDLREGYLKRLVAELDTDQDGKVSRRETAKHPLFVSGRRFADNPFLESLRTQKDYTEDELRMAIERAAGQLVTFRQNSALTDQDLSVFRVLDENESGLIERAEMRTAPSRLAARDLDFDQCITFDEFLSESTLAMMNQVVSTTSDAPPMSVHSEMLRDATEKILPPRLVRRYDTDRDAKLSASELGWTDAKLAALDQDGDKLLNVQELTGIANGEPDLWFAIDLSMQAQPAMTLVAGLLAAEVNQPLAEVFKVAQAGNSLTVTYRRRDPVEEAERNARTAFNTIDADGNGYLDREEIVDHQRFERYLFDAMDTDGDDRVFAAEMLSYVKAYTEPASTTCQVTLFDTGNGFFSMLDENGDGRISIRELRRVETNLLAASNANQQLNPSQLTKSFRIEIQRGGISLFGKVERPEAETPNPSLSAPSGPVWFQRMDRNGDGDLTWDEFLGPRDVFHQLDRDQDGLIDSREAAAYRK